MKSVQVRLVGRFRLERKIPGQHQRLLYSAVHTQNQSLVFLKGDQNKKKTPPNRLSILQEGKILQTMQGGIGIPHMHWCGTEQDYSFIVLEELSSDLRIILKRCENKFSLKTSLLLGIQLISILQYYHFKNFLHCNLKPEHLMMGSGSKYGKLYIVDYSTAQRYRDAQTLQHICQSSQKKIEERLINMEFSSINYHSGGTFSRKDDIISMIYLIAYFQKGSLPWSYIMNFKKNDTEKSRQILELKKTIPPKEIFQGCPDLLMLYESTIKLKFEQKPRYSYYKNVFRQRMQRQGFLEDGIYDWMLLIEDDEEFFDEVDYEIQIIPNQKQFLKKLEQEMRVRDKVEQEKIVVERKGVEDKKSSGKDKDCVIF